MIHWVFEGRAMLTNDDVLLAGNIKSLIRGQAYLVASNIII